MKISDEEVEWIEKGQNGVWKWRGNGERFERELNNTLETLVDVVGACKFSMLHVIT